MTVAIPKKIESRVKDVSQRLGVSKEDFLTNAVLYYLDRFKKRIELKRELGSWKKASDEDLMKFESRI